VRRPALEAVLDDLIAATSATGVLAIDRNGQLLASRSAPGPIADTSELAVLVARRLEGSGLERFLATGRATLVEPGVGTIALRLFNPRALLIVMFVQAVDADAVDGRLDRDVPAIDALLRHLPEVDLRGLF
jgi:hypothetical protein